MKNTIYENKGFIKIGNKFLALTSLTSQPSMQPSSKPSVQPSQQSTNEPSTQPTNQPSETPKAQPTVNPNCSPSNQPWNKPSSQPTDKPSIVPINLPTSQPSHCPTKAPSSQPTNKPSGQPSSAPTYQPNSSPTSHPTNKPSGQPSSAPTYQPSSSPTSQPTSLPSAIPSRVPTSAPIEAQICRVDPYNPTDVILNCDVVERQYQIIKRLEDMISELPKNKRLEDLISELSNKFSLLTNTISFITHQPSVQIIVNPTPCNEKQPEISCYKNGKYFDINIKENSKQTTDGSCLVQCIDGNGIVMNEVSLSAAFLQDNSASGLLGMCEGVIENV